MPGKTIFGQIISLLVIVYIGWVMLATTPESRMERACRPVQWTGNVTVSLTNLTVPQWQAQVQDLFDRGEYGCQYSLWRLFYESEYKAAAAEGVAQEPTVYGEEQTSGDDTQSTSE